MGCSPPGVSRGPAPQRFTRASLERQGTWFPAGRRLCRSRCDAAACHDRKTAALSAVFAGIVRATEFALVAGIGSAIAYFYVADLFLQYASALALAGFASVTVFQTLGLYNMAALSSAHRQLPRLLLGWTVTVGLLLTGLFFLKVAPDFSRAWLALWYASCSVALVAYRALVAALTRHGLAQGQLTRRAIVYGTGPACENLLRALDRTPIATFASAAFSTTAASNARAPTLPVMRTWVTSTPSCLSAGATWSIF